MPTFVKQLFYFVILTCSMTITFAATAFSAPDIKSIVDAHNFYRAKVVPTASNMRLMTWDKSIASLAQNKADQCVYAHGAKVYHPTYGALGENIYITSGMLNPTLGVERPVSMWYEEYKYYNYPAKVCTGSNVCHHYTQLVWAKSTKVGCGITYCTGNVTVAGKVLPTATLVFCEYYPPGNVEGGFLFNAAMEQAYTKGPWCSACPATAKVCVKNLCATAAEAGNTTTASTPAVTKATTATPAKTPAVTKATTATPAKTPAVTKATTATPAKTPAVTKATTTPTKTPSMTKATTTSTRKPAATKATTPSSQGVKLKPTPSTTVSPTPTSTSKTMKTGKALVKPTPVTPTASIVVKSTPVTHKTKSVKPSPFGLKLTCYTCKSTGDKTCQQTQVKQCGVGELCITTQSKNKLRLGCASQSTCNKKAAKSTATSTVRCCMTNLCNKQIKGRSAVGSTSTSTTKSSTGGGTASTIKPPLYFIVVSCAVLLLMAV